MASDDLRALVRDLQADASLDAVQRARIIQQHMSGRFRAAPQPAPPAEAPATIPPRSAWHDEAAGQPGCAHYRRGCALEAACCGGRFFVCRLCHDEAAAGSHELDRAAVARLQCLSCGAVQAAGEACEACGQRFARYACLRCRLFDDDPEHFVYHCDDCGLCRRGRDSFHCARCAVCMPQRLRGAHRCVERALASNCPICRGHMHSSTAPVTFLPCGHCLHVACYEQYRLTNYVCPLCSKSLANMEAYFKLLDAQLAREELPDEFRDRHSRVYCSDCERHGVSRFHFVHHKCQHCGSYNTKLAEVILDPDVAEAERRRLAADESASEAAAAAVAAIAALPAAAVSTSAQADGPPAIGVPKPRFTAIEGLEEAMPPVPFT